MNPVLLKYCFLLIMLLLKFGPAFANQDSTENSVEGKLRLLAESSIPELNNKVELSVSGTSLREFIRALAKISDLNVNIAPNVAGVISNNFNKESTLNILVFICREYNLQLEVVGSILSFSQIQETEIKAPRVYAVSYSSFNDHLSIDVKDDTLFHVLKAIVEKSNKNVIAAPDVRYIKVSCFVQELPFKEAIESLAFGNDLKMAQGDDHSFYLESTSISNNAQTNNLGAQRRSGNKSLTRSRINPNHFGTELRVEEIDGYLFVDANFSSFPIDKALKMLSQQTGLDYVFLTNPEENISLQVHDMEHDEFLRTLLNANSYSYQYRNNFYLIGKSEDEGMRVSEMIQLKNRSIKNISEFIPAELKEGMEIKEFNELNALLISGSEWQIDKISVFLEKIDRLVPVVQIEVIVVDVRKGRDISTGITAGISDSVESGGTILPGIDFTLSSKSINGTLEALDQRNIVNLGRVNPNFYTSLKAMEQNNNLRIRSTPKLATLNGHEASLTIGNTEYYLEQTQNVQGANNIVTTITPQYREISADLSIKIAPTVSAEEHVTLEIEAEFSDFTPAFVPNGPPGKSSRKFNSMIRLRNNEMIVLGGLEEESKSKSNSGIPLLARIPVINWFFSSRNNAKSNSQLMVFIRPTIIY